MNDVIYLSLRIGFLVLLWVFIFSALLVMKTDLKIADKGFTRASSARRKEPVSAAVSSSPNRTPSSTPTAVKIIHENGSSKKLPLISSPFTIGRSDSVDITIDDSYASSKHARFYYNNGRWFIEDTGSTNGTFINNERLTMPVQIGIGSKINIGRTTLEII